MKIGEVGLLTNNVVKLANFYKKLLEIDNDSDDEIHQTHIYLFKEFFKRYVISDLSVNANGRIMKGLIK